MTNAILICLPALVIFLGYVALLVFEKMHPVPAAARSPESSSALVGAGNSSLVYSTGGDYTGRFTSDDDIFEAISALVEDKKRQRRSGS